MRRKAMNRESAARSHRDRIGRGEALAAEVEGNQAYLDEVTATLEWELAGKAAMQVQVEEIIKLRTNLKALRLPPGDK